ncbi:MAG: hypothetical protein ACE5JS_08775 [Nitrospinota bacterium]
MADERIQSTEEMVGAAHATKTDTLNRLFLANSARNNDGSASWWDFDEEASAPANPAASKRRVYFNSSGVPINRNSAGAELKLDQFPTGTTMVFGDATPPTGWTQTAHNDQVLRVTSGAGGGTGGTASVAGGTVNTDVHSTAAVASGAGPTVLDGPAGSHSITYNLKFRNVITATKD